MIIFYCRTLQVAKQQPLVFRGLRGLARTRSHINESHEVQDQLQKPVAEEVSKKSYRTYRQKIKQLKSKFSCQLVNVANQDEMVKNAVTMLHNLPYPEQLEMKQAKHQEIIDRLVKQKNIRGQMARQRTANIIASSDTEQYRNKSTMSVGYDIQGNLTGEF